MRYIDIPGESLPHGAARKPFSDAVLAGEMLYVGGRVGLDPSTGRPPPQLADEARCLMENLRGVLEAAEMSLRDLVQVTVFATNVNDFVAFNAVYLDYFGEGPLPARAFIGSGPLLFGARFELTAVAMRPD
jgi:reactive intermediate/imine deaminase